MDPRTGLEPGGLAVMTETSVLLEAGSGGLTDGQGIYVYTYIYIYIYIYIYSINMGPTQIGWPICNNSSV